MWNLPPPPGFQGLHPEKPVHCYQRHMPHWRQDGATYVVTLRLGDSLPQTKLRELDAFRREWERLHPSPQPNEMLEQLAREITSRVDRWLDQGYGDCDLAEPALAEFLVESLHHFDIPSISPSGAAFPGRQHPNVMRHVDKEDSTAWEGRPTPRYELGCYVIMPNHLHAVVRPLEPQTYALEDITGGWKQYSSHRINREQGLTGSLWQDESYDRIIRDEEHLWRVIQYIGRNPVRAKLSPGSYTLWVRPEWEALGWTFESRLA